MTEPPVRSVPWGTPTLLGVPLDANSSYRRGAAAAPPRIRDSLSCGATNLWTETAVDVGAPGAFADSGDLDLPGDGAFRVIEEAVGALLRKGRRPAVLGGDHSITYPVLRALGPRYPGLIVVQFDAHPDLYDEFGGSRFSHASPFARIMEERLAGRLIQIGVRTLNAHQRRQAHRFQVEIVPLGRERALEDLDSRRPVYLSIDLDVLDPAFAPGVSHREPGGLTVREFLGHLHSLRAPVVGADLVEFNPACDVSGLTAAVAGKILKEILGRMIASTI